MADLSEWLGGQKYIKLLDPNLLACKEHMELLGQLGDSGAMVDFTQGLDCRPERGEHHCHQPDTAKRYSFCLGLCAETDAVLKGLRLYSAKASRKVHGAYRTVYCLTGYDTTMEENLHRILHTAGHGL